MSIVGRASMMIVTEIFQILYVKFQGVFCVRARSLARSIDKIIYRPNYLHMLRFYYILLGIIFLFQSFKRDFE